MRLIATIVSRLFDPFIMLTIVIGVLLRGQTNLWFQMGYFAGVPLILFILARITGIITDWDISIRSQRPVILWMFNCIIGVGIILFQAWNILPFFAGLVIFTLITHSWKISGHAFGVSTAAFIVCTHFGWQLWPTILTIPIVAWARVLRGDHTKIQFIAGSALGAAVVFAYETWFSIFR